MLFEESAPLIEHVLKEDYELDKRKLKQLIKIRLTYGKSTFYDSHTYKRRYPVEVIALALVETVRKAKRCGEQLELSVPELRLWKKMFPSTGKGRSKPDRKKRQVSA